MNNNSTQLFAVALGLQTPWRVESIDLKEGCASRFQQRRFIFGSVNAPDQAV